MLAAFYLLLITNSGVSASAYASRDFCEAARAAVAAIDAQARGVCVSSGAVERAGEMA